MIHGRIEGYRPHRVIEPGHKTPIRNRRVGVLRSAGNGWNRRNIRKVFSNRIERTPGIGVSLPHRGSLP